MSAPLRVVFMGTPDFAVPSLRALVREKGVADVIAVYTQPDRPAGRGQQVKPSAVKSEALSHGLPVYQPENVNDPNELRKLADCMADIVVVVAYAQFLSTGILNTPRLGCINVHSSLLPKYRGAAPIQYAIWHGETETGVTIMRLVKKMDAGPILLQVKTPITESTTTSELHDRLANLGAEALVETLKGLRAGTIKDIPQDESKATYAALIKKQDGLLRFTKPGKELIRQIHALNPWPGAYYESSRGILKIHRARFEAGQRPIGVVRDDVPGTIEVTAGQFFIRCADGWLEVLELQQQGKRTMSATEFLNGVRSKEELKIK